MIHLANILIVTDDPTSGQDLLGKIHRAHYDGKVVASLEAALASARIERPDAILVSSPLDDQVALELGQALKQSDIAEIPLCLVAGARSAALKNAAYVAGIDDVLSPPLDDAKLSARLRPLLRLSTMQAELHRRAQTSARFGITLDENLRSRPVDPGYPLLLVGPEAERYAEIFPDAKIRFATDPFSAEELLEQGHFDAAVLLPAGNPGPYLDLCSQTRNNPRLFNLPVVVVTDTDTVGETVSYHYGASGYFVAPVVADDLKISVLSLVRRQRLRWSIRESLGKALQSNTRDPATGVYTRAFFEKDLADRVPYAVAHRRPLTLCFFQIPDIEQVRVRFGGLQAEHLRLQVAQWITGLLRGEDLTARYDENEFCVLLPDTAGAEAEFVLKRISGVLAYTDFAVRDVYQPVKIWARFCAANLAPDDTADSLLERARQTFLS